MLSQFTDAELVARGYREHPPSKLDKGVTRIFQRRFDDDGGQRYFITFREWQPDAIARDRLTYDALLSTETVGDGYLWATLQSATIEQVERLAEALWKAAGGIYYERI